MDPCVQTSVKDMPAFGRGFADIKSGNLVVRGADFVTAMAGAGGGHAGIRW